MLIGFELDVGLFFRSTNHHRDIQLTTYCLPYMRLPKTPNLKMATVMCAETFDDVRNGITCFNGI